MSGEKTEQPSAKRLREAREKGQVAKSQEIPAAAVVMSLALYFMVRGGDILVVLENGATVICQLAFQPFETAFGQSIKVMGYVFLNIIGPLVPLVIVASGVSNLLQVGILISLEAAKPKLENLSPAKWFKKTFSKNNLIELLKNLIKVGAISAVVYKILSEHWYNLFKIPYSDADGLGKIMGATVLDLTLSAAVVFSVLAAADFIYQKFKYTKDNMMTKDEVKREYKEMEGDPIIKGRRRQLHQEMATQGAMDGVRKSKVLVTNPTHYAIAIDYERDKMALPIIMAKGEGELAKRMIEVAKMEKIPILQNAPLARDLFDLGSENNYIPRDLIVPVAEVINWLNSLSK
ncbi:MAG: type III secretion system export apparatus subunit SctU [Deltaproteobacteria bacterium]|jgi:type III secretion protein U|nr:type III secretion system export apparatus subunit SctU [Deltaproteobacteria bacterium]